MRFVCLSDTHGHHRQIKVPEGDVLIHAGDFSENTAPLPAEDFLDWLSGLPHARKFVVAGNHDFVAEMDPDAFRAQVEAIPGGSFLCDSGLRIGKTLIWGSPYTPNQSWAFNRASGRDIRFHWRKIPSATRLLITHGPPRGVLDLNGDGVPHGCSDLRREIDERLVVLKLHVFGHIHEGGGEFRGPNGCRYVNASICDGNERPVRKPVVVNFE